MCRITNEGYKFNDGSTVPFHDLNLANLSKEKIIELYDTPMNAFEGVAIRNTIFEIKHDIKKQTNIISQTLEEFKNHSKTCSKVTPEEVERIVLKEINEGLEPAVKEVVKSTILNSGNIAKALMAILILLGFIGVGVSYLIEKMR